MIDYIPLCQYVMYAMDGTHRVEIDILRFYANVAIINIEAIRN